MEGFSVLMSVYAKENPDHFRLALKSNLTDQTRKPSEMILVCDGPLTDALDAVIDEFTSQYPDILKVHRLPQNGGLGKALNFGLEKCTHDLVARADSDDINAPERFEVQIDYLEKHPEIDILGSHIDEFEEDWLTPGRVKYMPLDHSSLVKMAKSRNPINHMTVVFRKATVVSVDSYLHLPYVEDYYLWVRAIANGAVLATIDAVLVHARVGNGMLRRRGNKAQIKSWNLLNQYMLRKKMINCVEYAKNMCFIVGFTYAPGWLKAQVYEKLLRQ